MWLSVGEDLVGSMQGIQKLLVHFLSVMNHLEGDQYPNGNIDWFDETASAICGNTLKLGRRLRSGIDTIKYQLRQTTDSS